MKNKIKIGIVGYGNLGKGTELAIKQNKDIIFDHDYDYKIKWKRYARINFKLTI